MKINKYLEKVALTLAELGAVGLMGASAFTGANALHKKENSKRENLGLEPEKKSIPRGVSTTLGSTLGALGGTAMSHKFVGGGIGGLAFGIPAAVAGGVVANKAHRALFNESVEEALEKSKHRKQ